MPLGYLDLCIGSPAGEKGSIPFVTYKQYTHWHMEKLLKYLEVSRRNKKTYWEFNKVSQSG